WAATCCCSCAAARAPRSAPPHRGCCWARPTTWSTRAAGRWRSPGGCTTRCPRTCGRTPRSGRGERRVVDLVPRGIRACLNVPGHKITVGGSHHVRSLAAHGVHETAFAEFPYGTSGCHAGDAVVRCDLELSGNPVP